MEVLRRRSPKPIVALVVERALPPQVPSAIADLEEAATLLGAYVQTLQVSGKFKASRAERLKLLVGTLPSSIAVAKEWKSGLKELRSELAGLDARQRPDD